MSEEERQDDGDRDKDTERDTRPPSQPSMTAASPHSTYPNMSSVSTSTTSAMSGTSSNFNTNLSSVHMPTGSKPTVEYSPQGRYENKVHNKIYHHHHHYENIINIFNISISSVTHYIITLHLSYSFSFSNNIKFNSKLGSGAYKDVWRAYDTNEGMEVAWNVVKLSRIPPSERKRVKTELQLLKNIQHDNVLTYYNSWVNREREEIVFVTEIMSSGSLKE